MTIPTINDTPFLFTSRRFPQEPSQLSLELSKSYIEIANAVNTRSIGIFPASKAAINGQRWYLGQQLVNPNQQGFTQVYPITSFTTFNHGLNLDSIDRFTQCWGGYTDGTNWNGVTWALPAGIAGQVTFYITSTQVVFVGVAAITKGQIVLQWIAL